MSEQIAYRYKHGMPTMIGLPAKDLTVEEFQRLSPDIRRRIKALPAYEPVEHMSASQLNAMKRADLNAHAASQGVADPDAYESKDALIKVLLGEEPPRQTTPPGAPPADPGPAPVTSDEDGEDA